MTAGTAGTAANRAPAGRDVAASGCTPLDLPLDRGGTTFIEASAGTGKTHALTTLVARLVLEQARPIDRILVVTFTRAATAELRDRIRRVLRELLAAVRSRLADVDVAETGIDSQVRELLAGWECSPGGVDFAPAARRLEAAMHDIDRANVFTIHGFCQRVLADLAFESGFPFGCEITGNDGEMAAGAVRDFWRRRLYPASMLLTRHAVENGLLPDGLGDWVTRRRAKVGAVLVGCDPPAEPVEASEALWREVFEAARAAWECHGSAFRSEIAHGTWLNRQRYQKPRTTREMAALEALFAASEPWLPGADACGRYGREQLSLACKKGHGLPVNPLFDALDRLEQASGELRAVFDQWLRWVRREALAEVRESVRKRIRTDRRLAYDDLLTELDDALGRAGGARLAQRIRREFPCALIDEYQDTDPVQARIFHRIYGLNRAEPAPGDSAGVCGPESDGSDTAARTSGTAPPARVLSGHLGAVEAGASDSAARTAGTVRSGPDETSRVHAPKLDESGSATRAPGSAPLESGPSGRVDGSESGSPVAGDEFAASAPADRIPAGPFIVVGDPKQSIYRFRGADVFAYLAARRTARERLHLDRNWRSVPALVEAVNAVFAGAAPFVTTEIEYRPVVAAKGGNGSPEPVSRAGGGPLDLWLLPRSEDGKPLAKKDAGPIVAGATANEIARLLELGARGEATIEGRPLTGADVAVLVRTREQGRRIAGELHERGVRSIEIDDGSVFHTREAEQLERLLWSVADQGREAGVRGALAGDLFGLDAGALLALGEDESAWGAWVGRIADWRAHWESRGIGSLVLRLLEGEGAARHLLRQPDGARRLTNYRHLAEVLQACETRERLAPAELAAWLNRRRLESGTRDEDEKLRIESDEKLVKTLTVHGSKGLEFPVVFCPFAWDAPGPKRRPGAVDTVYHLGAQEHYREVIDLDPDEEAKSMERLEEFAESVRLLYVALTRAKYRCVVAWGQVRGAEHSPLAWLLHRAAGAKRADTALGSAGPDGPVAAAGENSNSAASVAVAESGAGGPDVVAGEGSGAGESGVVAGGDFGTGAPEAGAAAPGSASGMDASESARAVAGAAEGAEDRDAAVAALRAAAERFVGLDARAWRAEVEAFARRVPEAVSISVLDPVPPPIRTAAPSEGAPAAVAAREPRRTLRHTRSLTSFSALWAQASFSGGADDGLPAGRDEMVIDRPDHDQHEEPRDAAVEEPSTPAASAAERTAFTFPRGPVAGSCLHRIFERLDDPPALAPEPPDLDRICRDALGDFGIDHAWDQTARAMVERTRSVLLHETDPMRPDAGGGAVAEGAANPHAEAATDGGDGADAFRLDEPRRRLVELEFHFPVDGLVRERLGARMVEHGYPNPFAGASRFGASGPMPPVHGFLRGYVDLVVEHAGRWYILDYKSNWLGPGPDDYAPAALDAAMRAGGYTLQYLVYLVALHRYLAVRLPHYEYARHVGGAFYLFVRGIDPAAGMTRGVYFDRPSTECLLAIDECFRGVAA